MVDTKTEHFLGSDCSGSSGNSSRTITISNNGLTSGDGFLVYASGLSLALTSEYTVVHNSSSSVVTFVNAVWDDQTIIIQYDQSASGPGSQAGADDFINGPLSDFGVEVTRTPVTITTDFHGNKKYTDGTDETITVVFENPNQSYSLDKAGLTKVYDAKMFTQQDQAISKYDKITYDSKIYRVDNASIRNFNGNAIFKMVTLFYIEDE